MANCFYNCSNGCGCCPNLIKASSITFDSGTTTITVPGNSLTNLSNCQKLCIGLFTSIPTGVDCSQVVVTDGTNQYNVYKCNNQYWRPCNLKCRTILVLQYLNDPATLVLRKIKR